MVDVPDFTNIAIRAAIKALWYAATHEWPRSFVEPDTLPPPAGFSSWEAFYTLEGITVTDFLPLGPPAPEGGKCTVVFTRDGEDVATMGLHYVHANPDVVGDTIAWDDAADSATIEGLLTTVWNTLKGVYHASIQLDRFDWHHFGVGIRRPNPAFRSTLLSAIPGTSDTGDLPPQTAMSVTFKTDRRRSWGRVYMPAPTMDVISALNDARIDPAIVSSIRTAFGVMLDGAAAAHLPLVVWCPRRAGLPLQYSPSSRDSDPTSAHALMLDEPDNTSVARGVVQVQVDDLFDVQRRRRFDKPTLRDTHTIGG